MRQTSDHLNKTEAPAGASPCAAWQMETDGEARILSMDAPGGIRRRLIDLGFIPGTRIRCVLRKRRGACAAFFVRGTVIALRREDAAHIWVQPIQTVRICQTARHRSGQEN